MKPTKLNYDAQLDDAANAVAADDRELARACMDCVLIGTSHRAEAWLIQAWTCNSLQETEIALQRCLEIDPVNETAIVGLSWVQGIRKLAESQLEAKHEAEQAKQEADEARIQTEAKAKKEAADEARAKAEEKRKADEEARIKAEAEAKKKAEDEAQAKAEEKRKADEEARIKAEAEAKKKAEDEAQAKAVAKQKADEEARIKAEAKAKKKAEDEAQAKAEAKQKADDEARTKAEAEAKTKAEDEAQASTTCPNESVETKIEQDVVSLAGEVRQQVQADVVEATVINEPNATPVEAAPRKPIVLAIDDSPTIRKLVSLTLSSEGFEVVTAEDGIEALSILAEQLPDIILSDINMPRLGGYKLCKFVKKHERTKSIPVVMLSGNDGVFDKMRGKLSGCDDFISKPFEAAALVEKVRQHLAAVCNS